MSRRNLIHDYLTIWTAAQASEDGRRCAVAPHPELRERINTEIAAIRARGDGAVRSLANATEPRRPGFNDGMLVPPDAFPLGTPMSAIRSFAADRAPLRGALRVIVVLVDFADKPMAQTQQHYRDLFFSTGVIPTKSVREYYTEVTHGLIDIQGDVVGPFRLPQTLATYAHNAAGIGAATPNAQTMARDAVTASDPHVTFDPFDNDGNGFVDAFIVVHAGQGGEVTGNPGDIWSHKWVLDGGAASVDNTKIFAYLTVPEDALIGVCCHELGHLLFGFPDLYDTDGSSEGIGNWCLMAAGSWGGGGNTPCHPSAWCKANQGWVSVDNRTTNGVLSIPDVKDANTVYRLWKDGAPGSEYFLVENREKKLFDTSLPGAGLLIWHIDDSITTNTDESHYKVALLQADGRRDLELNVNRGDGGDCYPGSANNATFDRNSTPNSKSYAGLDTCVAVIGISAPAAVMTATVKVSCVTKTKEKEVAKDIRDTKRIEKRFEKRFEKRLEKPIIDKAVAFDKGFVDKPIDKVTDGGGKFTEGGGPGGFGQGGQQGAADEALAQLEARVSMLEAVVGQLGASGAEAQPFIGRELRPDLSQGALLGEPDYESLRQQMKAGSADAKRGYDTKVRE
jgi:immune inhibitor A